MHGMLVAMKVTIDKAGRMVIPRPLRERIGLDGGGTVVIEIEGSGLRIRPVTGDQLREEGDLLVIPRTGVTIDDTTVREIIDADRYRR
jgi:AbrB family looped-hinge helix DNA binding protein